VAFRGGDVPMNQYGWSRPIVPIVVFFGIGILLWNDIQTQGRLWSGSFPDDARFGLFARVETIKIVTVLLPPFWVFLGASMAARPRSRN